MKWIDTETTGIYAATDRIIEVAITSGPGLLTQGVGADEFLTLVDPERPIPPEATAIHGITDEDVRGAPKFAAVADRLFAEVDGQDIGGFSVKFDLDFFAAEFARLKRPAPKPRMVADALEFYRVLNPRTLTAALATYAVPTMEAHRALSDARAAALVFREMLHRHGDEIGTTPEAAVEWNRKRILAEFHDLSRVWRRSVYGPRLNVGKYKGNTLRWLQKNEPGFLEWMQKQDFSDDAKRIARGELP